MNGAQAENDNAAAAPGEGAIAGASPASTADSLPETGAAAAQNTDAEPTAARVLPPEGRLKTPPAQAGDAKDEVAKPAAQPVLQSVEEGKKELDANPARGSTLTEAGHLVRE